MTQDLVCAPFDKEQSESCHCQMQDIVVSYLIVPFVFFTIGRNKVGLC